MNRHTLIRAATALVAAASLAHGLGAPRATEAAESATGSPIEQASREPGFTLGRLVFSPCELAGRNSAATTAAYCTPFAVPEDWEHPDGRRIDLRLAIVRSDADVADRDLVVLLAGGPGQAATEVYPGAAVGFGPLLRHRDLVLLDQRGTGGSHALACDEEPTAVDRAAGGAIDLDRVLARTRECLARVGKDADPAQYTTGAAVRDLEAVRQALGAPPLDLVGVSYGTRVAQQYLARYPDAVRSIVLDSPVPNDIALGSEFAINLDSALKAEFAECTRTPACAKAFGDPYASLYRLRDRLAAKPVEVEVRQPRTFAIEKKTLDALKLASLVRLFAYSAETSALLPLTIRHALDGDYAPLVAQDQVLDDELSDLAGSGMQLSVLCAEDADLLADRPQDAGLILGDDLVRVLRAQCAIWPRGTRTPGFHDPVHGDTPALVLSGELDPVTPPRYGEAILKGLPNGRQLVAKGQGHSVMSRGCLPRLVARFVETRDAKGLDATCMTDFGPTPAFIDYNGAEP